MISSEEISGLRFGHPPPPADRVNAWVRYFARLLDIMVLAFVMMVVLTVAGTIAAPEKTDYVIGVLDGGILGSFLSSMIGIALALPAMILLLAYGQTPGKWWYGIRVRDGAGRRIGLRTSLAREWMIWTRGMGLGIPILSFIALILSYTVLTDTGSTDWDKKLACEVTHAPRSAIWWLRAGVGACIVMAANFYGILLAVFSI